MKVEMDEKQIRISLKEISMKEIEKAFRLAEEKLGECVANWESRDVLVFKKIEKRGLEYKGFFKTVNQKPEDEWILIFASDWFKERWAFYAYISLKNYEEDIKKIWNLIKRLNIMDGDIYIELIDHSKGLKEFYDFLRKKGYYTDQAILNPENWKRFKKA